MVDKRRRFRGTLDRPGQRPEDVSLILAEQIIPAEMDSWTPQYLAGITDFDVITMSTVTEAYYRRVGDLVWVGGLISTDDVTIGSASGGIQVSGLPYNVDMNGATASFAAVNVAYTVSFAGDHPGTGLFIAQTNKFALYFRATANAAESQLVPTDFTTGTTSNQNQVRFSGWYHTEDDYL